MCSQAAAVCVYKQIGEGVYMRLLKYYSSDGAREVHVVHKEGVDGDNKVFGHYNRLINVRDLAREDAQAHIRADVDGPARWPSSMAQLDGPHRRVA